MGKGTQMAIATLSVFVAVAWIVSSSEGTFQFYQHVDELLVDLRTNPAAQGRSDIRVHGFVVAGSIEKDLPASKVWFSIEDKIVDGKPVIGNPGYASEAADTGDAAVAVPAADTRGGTSASPAVQDAPVAVSPDASAPAASPARLAVVYNGIDLPDLFTDGAEVVVEGGMDGERFVARRVTAKCPSKYESAPELPVVKGAPDTTASAPGGLASAAHLVPADAR